uniref:Nuclear pore complex protein Nup153 n=1 Tax=Romanomermis culicivorax TaxID=13658 RepID=A0A915JCQ6_ROMCU
MGARQSSLENANSSSTADNGEDAPCSSNDSSRALKIPNGSPKRSFIFDDGRPLTSTALKCNDSDRLSTFVDEIDVNNETRIGSKRKRNNSPKNSDVDFYQAYNNTSSIISAPAASPQFTSSHLNADVEKLLSKNFGPSREIGSTKIDIPPDHPPKRLRLEVEDDNATFSKSIIDNEMTKKSTTDIPNRSFDRLHNFDSSSINKRLSASSGIFKPKPAAQVSLFSLYQKHKAAPSATPYSRPTSSLSVISSDTRRLLRDLERRTFSPTITKHIKTEQRSDASSPQPSQLSETTLPSYNRIDSPKPPVSSLITPYRANVLPRLATLNKAPYPKIVKETADKGVSADLIGSCFVDESQLSTLYEAKKLVTPKLTSTKSALKLKTVGGARNKFSAHGLEDDEPEVLYDNQLPTLPRLPLPAIPASGFLTSSLNGVTPGSPPADSFRFSAPILLARPSEINSPISTKTQFSPKMPNGHVKTPLPDETVDEQPKSKNLKLFSEKPVEFAKKLENPIDQWTCLVCFIKNPVDKEKCMACSFQRSAPIKTDTNKDVLSINGGKPHSKSFTYLKVPVVPVGHDTDINLIDAPKQQWSCSTCFIKNPVDKEKCMACNAQKYAALKTDSIKDKWTCEVCFIKNPNDQQTCQACKSLKPGEKSSSFAASNTVTDKGATFNQSWSCTECYIKVPGDKQNCIACGSPKPRLLLMEDTKQEDKKEENAKPWNCTTCFVKNPAGKVKCMACTTPKPGCTFAPISFGFKPTPPPKPPVETSSFGVQCTPEPDPAPSVSAPLKTPSFVPSFIIAKEEKASTEESSNALSGTASKTAAPFTFGFTSSSTTTASAPPLLQPTLSIATSAFAIPSISAPSAASAASNVPSFGFRAPLKTTAAIDDSLFAAKSADITKEKIETASEPKAPVFSFGATAPAATATTVPASTSLSSSLSFNFSSAPSAAPTFDITKTTGNSSGGFAFNLPTSSASTAPLFGNNESTLKKSTPLTFGFNTMATPATSAQAPLQPVSSTASSLFTVPASTTTTTTSKIASFGFNAPLKTNTAADTLFGNKLTSSTQEKNEPAVKTSLFSFGAPTSTAASATNLPLSFNFSAAASTAPAVAPVFGASTASGKAADGFAFNMPTSSTTTTAPLFGVSSGLTNNATSSSGFSFGLPGSNSTPNFQFGGTSSASVNFSTSPSTLLFGASSNTGLGQSTQFVLRYWGYVDEIST